MLFVVVVFNEAVECDVGNVRYGGWVLRGMWGAKRGFFRGVGNIRE